MLKRLIEVALPLKEVSEQSAREKSIRHGHISTLHIWWARRPLAACRAVVFASLIPDPDDPECPESFRQRVRVELGDDSLFRPAGHDAEGGKIEDTPRNRCLEFIKHLVRWENSNEPTFIEPARRLVRAAHKILHPDSDSETPKVLDPFAGGGAIPLEALRLGCEAHAIDINPVAHLIQLCTLVYPQKFGRPLPPDAPVPEYITTDGVEKGWFPSTKGKKAKQEGLFGDDLVTAAEAEYRRNPLAADVKYWGHWVLERARAKLAEFYPPDPDGSVPVAYLWARTVKCPNPACGATIPLVRQFWLCKRSTRKVALRMMPNPKTKRCDFTVIEGKGIDFDPGEGTIKQGGAQCPFCQTALNSEQMRSIGVVSGLGQQLTAAVIQKPEESPKRYRSTTKADEQIIAKAQDALAAMKASEPDLVPSETVSAKRPSSNSRGLSPVTRFGMNTFADLYGPRQLLTLSRLVQVVRQIPDSAMASSHVSVDAVRAFLALNVGRMADFGSTFTTWTASGEFVGHTFTRQALSMVWDFAEVNPFAGASGDWLGSLAWIIRVIEHCASSAARHASVCRGDATRLANERCSLHAVITDPPYYDSVPYADISDYFYIWLKRALCGKLQGYGATPLTPKQREAIMHMGRDGSSAAAKTQYEALMADAFAESSRVLIADGISAVMFAHRTTKAWEALVTALLVNGQVVTSCWPLSTERASRIRAQESASLASSVTIICRKRAADAGEGLWDDVRRELREVAGERLEFFWNQGIRGADFFISAIGPALSVFGRYERVVRLSGEEVTVGQFLDEVRDVVTHYALSKIVKGGQLGHIDSESQFYVVWRWSYGDAKVPADESFKLAQALGLETDTIWDRTGVLTKAGQNVQAMGIDSRMRVKDLGEPAADGTPASLIDTLHRLCAFRDKGDNTAMAEFLARSRHGRSESLWLVAQALSETLPDGDKEKQLLQGLLNQRDGLQEAARGTGRLF